MAKRCLILDGMLVSDDDYGSRIEENRDMKLREQDGEYGHVLVDILRGYVGKKVKLTIEEECL